MYVYINKHLYIEKCSHRINYILLYYLIENIYF